MWDPLDVDKLSALQGETLSAVPSGGLILLPTREAHPFLLGCLKEKSVVPKEPCLKKTGPNFLLIL